MKYKYELEQSWHQHNELRTSLATLYKLCSPIVRAFIGNLGRSETDWQYVGADLVILPISCYPRGDITA